MPCLPSKGASTHQGHLHRPPAGCRQLAVNAPGVRSAGTLRSWTARQCGKKPWKKHQHRKMYYSIYNQKKHHVIMSSHGFAQKKTDSKHSTAVSNCWDGETCTSLEPCLWEKHSKSHCWQFVGRADTRFKQGQICQSFMARHGQRNQSNFLLACYHVDWRSFMTS